MWIRSRVVVVLFWVLWWHPWLRRAFFVACILILVWIVAANQGASR